MVAPKVDSPMNHDRDIVVYTSYTRHALSAHPVFYMLSSVEAFVMVWFFGFVVARLPVWHHMIRFTPCPCAHASITRDYSP